jgi:hypothetical protein
MRIGRRQGDGNDFFVSGNRIARRDFLARRFSPLLILPA